ncbi:MAG: NAD(P)H-hydrate dehydratase [Flavobacteriaceae bacterium]|nr:NAD(P)H-hydrate dehydratase [Flavobacteriaceae bacterium]
MKIFTAKQMYEADKATEAKEGITSIDLMERAARQAFEWIDNSLKGSQVPIHIFCGIGNNGGDGMALGRMLLNKGYTTHCYVVNYSEKRSKCFLINYDRYKNTTKVWPKLIKGTHDFPELTNEGILVDAIFGIGLNRPLEGWVKELVQHINKANAFTLSIDIPSGLFIDAPTPDFEAVIKANLTLTFQAPKLPFFLPETAGFTQSFQILDIGLDPEYLFKTPTEAKLILKNDTQGMYLPRRKFDHKGSYGHALIVGGSYGKMGAVTLATKSCLRSGAGKVTAYIPKCGYSILQTAVPEAMVNTDENEKQITQFPTPGDYQAIGIGIGLGTHKETAKGFANALKNQKAPLVLDADALNLLSENKELLELVPPKSVLTPHPGELQRLIGNWKNDFDKLAKTKKLSKELDSIIVIKGAHTITVYKDNLYINTTGNPGMATAGTGDVLTGIITGLIAQGYDPLIAAVFGVYLHGSAGDIASQHQGFNSLIAGDLIDFLGDVFLSLLNQSDI